MLKYVKQSEVKHLHPQGFTLVEMLVAVGLLLLLMSILAQMFAIASTAIRTTRGIANNDQKSRILYTVIGSDLSRISYGVFDQETGLQTFLNSAVLSPSSNTIQSGYVYVSENDPLDDTDDVLAFTADSQSLNKGNKHATPYYGRAKRFNALVDDNNEPGWDDGIIDDDSTSSRYTEVCYFLRKGILYRQIFIVRDGETIGGGPNLDMNVKPVDSSSLPLLFTASTFYNDYNTSGYHDTSLTITSKVTLHGTLKNDSLIPLGNPALRTGFHHEDGKPMEFWDDGTNRIFMGRFTMNELSDNTFLYPVNYVSRTDLTTGHITSIYDAKGVLSKFGTPSNNRIGADILLTNVLSFDVKLWDFDANKFVDIGNNPETTTYETTNNSNTTFSDGPFGNTFDTWHASSTAGTGKPPYSESIRKQTAYGTTWLATTPYNVGDVVFHSTVTGATNAYIYFLCTQAGTSGSSEPTNAYSTSDITDGTVIWRTVINEKPLKGLKVTVRFQDAYTGQVRQMAIYHSFAEN